MVGVFGSLESVKRSKDEEEGEAETDLKLVENL